MLNRGLILAVGAALSFSIMNIMVKSLSFSMGSGEIVFGRSVIGIIVLLFIMKEFDIKFSNKDIPALVFRGAVGGMSMFLIFIAISGMHLGDVAILQQLSAIFVLFLSAVWLKEKIPPKTFLPLLAIGAGTMLLLRPWEYNSFSIYAILAVFSAFLAALAYITIHKLFEGGGHNSWEIVFYFLFCSMLIGIAGMAGNYHSPDTKEMFLLAGIGIVSLLAQALMTQAYGSANAVLVSFVLYTGIFFNALWGYLFFGEIMHFLSVMGGVFIIGGSMYLTMAKKKLSIKRNK
ncbi:DMT family transporter [Pectinatus haikarae]|uniref:DMT family transporter n=1 Tax=Pectinatus haikarae TaxID=349096 RepID=UPI0018C484DF|nr:DMT family transporter [Pectinatus haikarae]